jgi:hypothetical protein
MSPYLPLTPDDIAHQAIEAAEAGAAILHLHARDPADGQPTPDPKVFDRFVPRIQAATDAIINITTGGSRRMTLAERLAYPLQAKPEMCSLNMGSMNFSIHPAARKIEQWRYDWEKPYVEGMEDPIFRNTFLDIRKILKLLGEDCGTRFEFECYDLGHLYNLPPELPLLGARRRAPPDAAADDGRGDGRQRARRPGRQPLSRQGKAREVVRRAGPQDPAHPGRTVPGNRDARRSAGAAGPEGPRGHGHLKKRFPPAQQETT